MAKHFASRNELENHVQIAIVLKSQWYRRVQTTWNKHHWWYWQTHSISPIYRKTHWKLPMYKKTHWILPTTNEESPKYPMSVMDLFCTIAMWILRHDLHWKFKKKIFISLCNRHMFTLLYFIFRHYIEIQ